MGQSSVGFANCICTNLAGGRRLGNRRGELHLPLNAVASGTEEGRVLPNVHCGHAWARPQIALSLGAFRGSLAQAASSLPLEALRAT